MRRHSLAALTIFALAGWSLPVEARAESEVLTKSLIGCWTRHFKEPDEYRWRSTIMYCLKSNGKLYGAAVSHGLGGDFGGQWRVQANRLILTIEDDRESCGFVLAAEREALTLTDCESAGIYKREKTLNADTADETSK